MIQFGKYMLLEKLAEGGMAEIFLAAHTGPGGFAKLMVLKRILPHLAVSPEFRQMLLDEARIAATLNHPNIVQTFEVDTVSETLYIAMEHLSGEDVRAITRAVRGPLPLGAALGILIEACKGLTYAHQKTFGGAPLGIVHRDLSPRNLFVTYDGSVKILDFGVARARDRLSRTRTGELKGSLPYMSPEQVRQSRDLDHRSDIFTLGIVLWELTTGARLFTAQADFEVLRRIATDPIQRPSEVVPTYPPALEAVVMRALEREPAARHADCRELQADLEELALKLGVRTGSLVLSELMSSAFAERIARARDLERDLPRRLAEEPVSPLAGATGAVETTGEHTVNARRPRSHPEGPDPEPATVSAPSSAPVQVRSGTVSAARRSSGRFLGLAALGVSGLVGLAAWLLAGAQDRQRSTPSPSPTLSPTAGPGPTPTPTPASPAPAAPPSAATSIRATDAMPAAPASAVDAGPAGAALPTVSVEIETVPPGAEVRRDGVRLGTTPVQLTLPRSEQPLLLRLERRGHVGVDLPVVTTGDRRIVKHLRRRPGAGPAAIRPRPTGPTGRKRGSGPDDLVDPFR